MFLSLTIRHFVVAWLLLSLSFAAQAFTVADIRVEGLQRISAGTVFNYLPIKPGSDLQETDTPKIIKTLYQTGFFKDVRLERDGDVLIIYVVERPAIYEINITGNKSIETDALLQGLEDTGLATGRTFNRSVLDRIELELKRQFFNSGKYGVELTSTVTPLERNRVAIDIEILEGETATIKQINIVGNDSFEEDDLLDEFKQTTGGLLSFYTKDNQYSRQKLAADLETLRSYYLDRGYVNFKVDSTQVTITPDKNEIYITINITEGDVYSINDIKMAGEMVVEPESLFPLIHLRRGEAFSRKHVVESTDRISKQLSDMGYAFANVNGIPEIDEETKTVAVTFFVDPGKRVYVRRISIRGNSQSRDEVIRREMRQMESAWFSSEKVKLSRERLQRTGYFDEVNIETPAVPGSTDEVDVNVAVVEKPSGAFLAGLGFSQSSGIIFNTSLSQDNFLGTGKRVNFAFNNSDVNTQYSFGIFNPYYTVDGISRGFNLSYRETDYEELDISNYATDNATASLNYGIPLTEFNRFGFGVAVEKIDMKLGVDASQDIRDYVAEEGDDYLNFKLSGNWKHDSRDSAIFPKVGSLQRFNAEVTVPGSDLTFYKVSYSYRQYIPLADELTFSYNMDLGYGDSYSDTSRMPFYENFYAGGPKSLRGFEAASLGPKDVNGDALGGNAKAILNFELLFPPPYFDNESVRLYTFADVGNVFDTTKNDDDDVVYSVGVGGMWLSPLGALGVSFAIPGNEGPDDETEEFQFTFGSAF